MQPWIYRKPGSRSACWLHAAVWFLTRSVVKLIFVSFKALFPYAQCPCCLKGSLGGLAASSCQAHHVLPSTQQPPGQLACPALLRLWAGIIKIKVFCLCSLNHWCVERRRARLMSHLCLDLQRVTWCNAEENAGVSCSASGSAQGAEEEGQHCSRVLQPPPLGATDPSELSVLNFLYWMAQWSCCV